MLFLRFRPAAAMLAGTLLVLCSCLALPARAQSVEPSRFAARAGLAMAGTGDDANCPRAGSLVGGLEARTRGRWFVALTADLHLGLPFACTDMATLVPYDEERWAYLGGGSFFALAPRPGLRIGMVATDWLEPSLGGGVVFSTELSGDRFTLQPWASGAVAVRLLNPAWSVQAEYGMHRVELRHEIHRMVGPMLVYEDTRQFPRWEPLLQVALRRDW
jgi:hypothetical protein